MKPSVHIRGIRANTLLAIYNFKKQPVMSLGGLLTVFIESIAVVGVFFSIIVYACTGCFKEQAELIKMGNLKNAFTWGTLASTGTRIIVIIILGLITIEFLIMFIMFFKNERVGRKIIMSVALFVVAIATLIISWQKVIKGIKNPILEMNSDMILIKTIMLLIVVASIITIVCLVAQCCSIKKYLWNTFYASLVVFVIAPIILLGIINAIPIWELFINNIEKIAGVIFAVFVGSIFLAIKFRPRSERYYKRIEREIQNREAEIVREEQRRNDHLTDGYSKIEKAKNGGGIIFSKEELRRMGYASLEQAEKNQEYIEQYKKEIEELKWKLKERK